ncbi:flavo domain protein [Acinetobacter baumannii 348935]|nr:flavo domain protein [Acinetobacter baumannii 348935]
MYSLSFAPKTDWSKRYAEAPEIFSYIQDLVSHYNLRAFARLNTEVLGVHYQ